MASPEWHGKQGFCLAFKTSPPEAADRLLQADVILGTSAGAIVGAQLGSGVGLADLYARQLSVSIDQTPPRLDVTALMTVFEAAAADTNGSITQRLKMVGLPCHIPVFASGTPLGRGGHCLPAHPGAWLAGNAAASQPGAATHLPYPATPGPGVSTWGTAPLIDCAKNCRTSGGLRSR